MQRFVSRGGAWWGSSPVETGPAHLAGFDQNGVVVAGGPRRHGETGHFRSDHDRLHLLGSYAIQAAIKRVVSGLQAAGHLGDYRG